MQAASILQPNVQGLGNPHAQLQRPPAFTPAMTDESPSGAIHSLQQRVAAMRVQ